MHPDWIIPDWPAPSHVRAVITTREGGVSTGPYANFNLGHSTGDDAHAVDANRERLRELLPEEPRWLKQVHGARVLRAQDVVGRPDADASLTDAPGTVCAILVADCIPVLFTNQSGTCVAAAHAGWRGLAEGVLQNTVGEITRMGSSAGEVLAYIGPGIGPTAFEVGDDVYEAFTAREVAASSAFQRTRPGKWLANLPLLARLALARCGVHQVYGGELCTYSSPQRFYSYRRDRVTGRMGAFIWLTREIADGRLQASEETDPGKNA